MSDIISNKAEAPIVDGAKDVMNALAATIDRALHEWTGKRWGFALLVFQFENEPEPRSNYISNADRADMVAHMKELVARFEGRMAEEPGCKQ